MNDKLKHYLLSLEEDKIRLERQVAELSFLFSISTTLNSTYNLDSLLQTILEMAVKTTHSEAGSLFIVNRGDLRLISIQGEGTRELNEYLSKSSPLIRRLLLFPRIMSIGEAEKEFSLWQETAPALRSLLLVPLQIENRLLGLIVLMHLHEGLENHREDYTGDDKRIISILAQQAALVWENTQLKIENERKSLYLETIGALTSAIDAKDVYTMGHSQRVAQVAIGLGAQLGLTEREINNLSYGATLHDIGKIGIKEEVLNKPGTLSKAEFALIQTHPQIGAGILEPVGFLKDSIDVVKYHHERYDGQGYPKGLKGEAIPFSARIVALADAWDAMTSQRAYRRALSLQEALSEIDKGAGGQFDPYMAEMFLREWEKILSLN